jgi:L-rhamnose mutarotase
MVRYARVLRLREGAEDEYDRLHAAVWPEVLDAIRRMGIANYSIFRYGAWLFSYFELPDGVTLDEAAARVGEDEACRRWEARMQTLQAPLPESTDGDWWVPMPEVFHVD